MGGGDHPHVDPPFAGRAQPPHPAVVEHPEQLGLGRRLELGDFVEEEAAAVRQLEKPGPLHRAGERAAFDPEKLGLDQGRPAGRRS